jgi:DNA-binding SARP family transcriptional activator/tetratricopeptide (TPR) repeat protein/energy-coupling factor transporter ATP-binding protein EcfA2
MLPLRLNLLGGFEARLGTGTSVILARRKAQALLAYLAVQPGQVQLRDKLAALLWGDSTDAQARHSLRQALLAIKQALPREAGEILSVGTDTVTLNDAAVDVDVTAFDRLLTRGTPEALREACALYRGEFLEGFSVREAPFEDWLLTQRERARDLAVDALARLLAHHVQHDAIAQAILTAARLLSLDPLQEAVHRTLMRLYARQGRRGTALRQYQLCVGVMQRELGVEPEAKTRQLYQEILEGLPAAEITVLAPPLPSASPLQQDDRECGSVTFRPETPMIGREAEMATLRKAWRQVCQRRGRIGVILGESGTGKSRLVAELAGEVIALGGGVFLGRAHDSEQILPFGPWIDALRAGRAIEELAAARENAIWLAELARLFPEFGASTDADADPEDHVRLFEAMAQIIGRLAAVRPLLLILEDLHWADEMSLRLLAFVSRRLSKWPVLLVATARSEQIADAPLLRRTLVELNGESNSFSLGLSALTQQATVTLVRTLFRAGTDDPTVRRLGAQIWRVSEGNPFMVVETMRALYEEDARNGDELRTPSRVRDVIALRLERLSARGRQLVALASVVGRDFDFALLDRAASIGTHAAAEAVEELVARRILHVVGEHLDFTHDRIREVAYDQQIAPRRKLMHAVVANAIEDLYRGDLEPHCVALGVHCRRAGLWEKAIPYLRRAGLAAARRSAHRQALPCFEQALGAMQHLSSRRDLLEQAIDLRFALRHSCVAVGEISQVADHLRQAEATAETLGDQLRLGWVLAYRTNSHLLLGENDKAMHSGQRAVSIARALAETRLRIAAHLHYGMTCQVVGQYRLGADLMRESIGLESELTARGDKPAQQIYTRTAGVLSLAELGEFAEGLARGKEAISIAETADRPYGLAHVCFGLGFLHLRKGELRRALRVLKRGLSLCRGLDAPLLAAALGALLGYGYALSGRPREGISLLDDAARVLSHTMHSESLSLILLAEAELR